MRESNWPVSVGQLRVTTLPVKICIGCSREFTSADRRRECGSCRHARYSRQFACVCGTPKDRDALQCKGCQNARPAPKTLASAEVSWLAGLIEGEGTFVQRQTQGRMRVQMTDRDVVQYLQQITGIGTVVAVTTKNSRHKDSWTWTVHKADHLRLLIQQTAPLLGTRRRLAALRLWVHGGAAEDDFPIAAEPSDGLLWLAGFLEGEGTFTANAHGDRTVEATSVDRDVLLRAQRIAGGGRIYELKARKPHHNPPALWRVYRRAEARKLAKSLLPHLFERRQSQARRVIGGG